LSTGDGSQWTIPTVSWCPPVHRGQFLMDKSYSIIVSVKCPEGTVRSGSLAMCPY